MKLSEFKEAINLRASLLKTNFIFTLQKETAYWANNWAGVISPLAYTIMYLAFLNVLFTNINTVAGYDKNEILLFTLVGQLAYYCNWGMSFRNMRDLIDDIKKGDLDLILTKPIPSLFYVSTRKISFFSTLQGGLPPTLMIILAINWGSFNFSLPNILLAFPVFICGLFCLHVFHVFAMLPVFWLGESRRIIMLAKDIEGQGEGKIPLEGYGSFMRVFLSTAFPVLIPTAFTTSILLNKTNPYMLAFVAVGITAALAVLVNYGWALALRHYSSASS